jgi:hypothetical protein
VNGTSFIAGTKSTDGPVLKRGGHKKEIIATKMKTDKNKTSRKG